MSDKTPTPAVPMTWINGRKIVTTDRDRWVWDEGKLIGRCPVGWSDSQVASWIYGFADGRSYDPLKELAELSARGGPSEP